MKSRNQILILLSIACAGIFVWLFAHLASFALKGGTPQKSSDSVISEQSAKEEPSDKTDAGIEPEKDKQTKSLKDRQQISGFEIAEELPADCRPCGISLSENGSLFITDTALKKIYKIKDEKCRIFTGKNKKKLFKEPWAIAPYKGGWAVSDPKDNSVKLITRNKVKKLTPENKTKKGFLHPTGLCAGKNGKLYISDTHNNRVCVLSKKGKCKTLLSGLNRPMGLCYYDGTLYIAETGANRVLMYSNGKKTVAAGCAKRGYKDGAAEKAKFSSPKGVCVGNDKTIYVSDTANGAIRRIKADKVDSISLSSASLHYDVPVSPIGILETEGTLYVCDSYLGALLKIPL